MSETKVEGIAMTIGGRELVIPPLNFARLKKIQPKIEQLTGIDITGRLQMDQVEAATDIVLCALQRNYPEITREEVEEMIDLGNIGPVFNAIMGLSGLVKGGAKAGSESP